MAEAPELALTGSDAIAASFAPQITLAIGIAARGALVKARHSYTSRLLANMLKELAHLCDEGDDFFVVEIDGLCDQELVAIDRKKESEALRRGAMHLAMRRDLSIPSLAESVGIGVIEAHQIMACLSLGLDYSTACAEYLGNRNRSTNLQHADCGGYSIVYVSDSVQINPFETLEIVDDYAGSRDKRKGALFLLAVRGKRVEGSFDSTEMLLYNRDDFYLWSQHGIMRVKCSPFIKTSSDDTHIGPNILRNFGFAEPMANQFGHTLFQKDLGLESKVIVDWDVLVASGGEIAMVSLIANSVLSAYETARARAGDAKTEQKSPGINGKTRGVLRWLSEAGTEYGQRLARTRQSMDECFVPSKAELQEVAKGATLSNRKRSYYISDAFRMSHSSDTAFTICARPFHSALDCVESVHSLYGMIVMVVMEEAEGRVNTSQANDGGYYAASLGRFMEIERERGVSVQALLKESKATIVNSDVGGMYKVPLLGGVTGSVAGITSAQVEEVNYGKFQFRLTERVRVLPIILRALGLMGNGVVYQAAVKQVKEEVTGLAHPLQPPLLDAIRSQVAPCRVKVSSLNTKCREIGLHISSTRDAVNMILKVGATVEGPFAGYGIATQMAMPYRPGKRITLEFDSGVDISDLKFCRSKHTDDVLVNGAGSRFCWYKLQAGELKLDGGIIRGTAKVEKFEEAHPDAVALCSDTVILG